ncbi:hypothetical protein [Telluribacter humicola]|uniref:hypothetical protein n=1 Tax=Telluribacter humicola TaxID=1720261 RepID=UPI001A95FB10|nr:hypothetical protein [Telluribacter humicola]
MKQPVLSHETRKAWQFQVELRDPAGQPIDLTGFAIKAQLRRVLDNRSFVTLSLGDGLTYTHPNLLFSFTAEQLDVPAGEYQLGFEYTSQSGNTSDVLISQVHLTQRFITT